MGKPICLFLFHAASVKFKCFSEGYGLDVSGEIWCVMISSRLSATELPVLRTHKNKSPRYFCVSINMI